jgi:hypothetical protein
MNGLSETDLRHVLRKACKQGGGVVKWSRDHNISDPYVCLVLSGHAKPGPKIAKALGYKKKVVFQPLQPQSEGA